MNFFKKITIKSSLTFVVGILIIVLLYLSITNVRDQSARNHEAKRMGMANELVDFVLLAASQEAVERGVTASAMASNKKATSELKSKIGGLRAKGDEAFKNAIRTARKLALFDPSNEVFIEAIDEYQDAHKSLEKMRNRADSELGKRVKDMTPSEVIAVLSDLIAIGADMRTDALSSPGNTESLHGPLRMNAEIKNSVWLASEYAGRERAMIGGTIGSGKPVKADVSEKLKAARAIVELNLARIHTLEHDADTDERILVTLGKVSEVFEGSFESVRQSVYAEMETGDYPMSAGEWVRNATEGINSILKVSTAISTVVKEEIDEAQSSAAFNMGLAIFFLFLTVVLAIISFIIVKYKITSPMYNLNEVMTYIEQSGDLTKSVNLDSQDEAGSMASAFNKMVHKFHDITRDIASSSDHLASASEELSASATQIANGTEEQSSRADHVATASQEMNATIVEVAKNASGAAEAAKNANEAANRGGDIVTKTIESMNGIAETARESSDVIATLGSRSQEIGKIIKVIDDIADQTNLLALNAAIEAARAGEQGRGFAVVADEVRKLAERTSSATKEIGEMITAIQEETDKAIHTMDKEVQVVEEGVGYAEEAGTALREIMDQVEMVTGVIEQIATASEEQSTAADQISGDIESVARITKDTNTGSQQIVQASTEMAELASSLQAAVSMFKTSEERAQQKADSVVTDAQGYVNSPRGLNA